ncbi:MAG: hypothetical protein ACYCT2_09255 [Thermoplasmataceae archaeon]
MLGTANIILPSDLILEISAIRTPRSQLKIWKSAPSLGFRSIAVRILVDLLKAMGKAGKEFLDAVPESIRKPYKSTMGATEGQIVRV